MQFPYEGRIVNLLDTPGHADFSEDTYRTLTAVDSALMVIDCAKGAEERTLKLMEVCRLRDTPIMTFINKLDRDGRPPIELLDEIESVLRIGTAPVTWPIGMLHSLARKSSAAHILALRVVSRARASLRLCPLEFPSFPSISRSRVSCRLLNIGMLEELLHVFSILPR